MLLNHDSVSELLSEELRRRLQDNPRYSLRSFARSLKMSPGSLSEILRGRRDLPLRSVNNVAKAIGLNSAEAQYLLHLVQKAKLKGEETLAPVHSANEKLVAEHVFALIAEWYHFAILNLMECEGFAWKDSWISSRLDISRTQAKLAMELLVKTGLVILKKDAVQAGSDHILTSSDIPSGAIRNYHRQILAKALAALETQDVSEREISGIGMAIDPSHIPAIKKEISEFQDRILGKYSRGKKKEVYFMELALFKLTSGEQK